MSSPQKESGYTPIANEIMEALARYRIPGEQRQCLDVIIRKTYGFNKKEDTISNSQFVAATGLKKQSVHRAINGLISKNVIKKADRYIPTYRFNKNYESWKSSAKKLTVSKKGNQLSAKKLPTKDNITKDNIGGINIPPCPHEKIIALYHKILPELPHIQSWPKTSKKNLQMRWREDPKRQTLDQWEAFFKYIAKSDFLMGRVNDFRADLMWIVLPTNFAKILNQKYHRNQPKTSKLEAHNKRILDEWVKEETENG